MPFGYEVRQKDLAFPAGCNGVDSTAMSIVVSEELPLGRQNLCQMFGIRYVAHDQYSSSEFVDVALLKLRRREFLESHAATEVGGRDSYECWSHVVLRSRVG